LISRIIRNRVLSAGEKPFMFEPSVRDTWSCIKMIGLFIRKDSRVWAIQKDVVIMIE
jgi:hypothetical protein